MIEPSFRFQRNLCFKGLYRFNEHTGEVDSPPLDIAISGVEMMINKATVTTDSVRGTWRHNLQSSYAHILPWQFKIEHYSRIDGTQSYYICRKITKALFKRISYSTYTVCETALTSLAGLAAYPETSRRKVDSFQTVFKHINAVCQIPPLIVKESCYSVNW